MIVGMLMNALREEMIMDHDRRTFLRSAAGIGAATIATKLQPQRRRVLSPSPAVLVNSIG
jgi:hypothetical protein